jgi:hypothetical protein
VVGPTEPDPKTQGYTLVAKTEFASMAEMRYYDDECEAHAKIKALAKTLTSLEGVMSVWFTPQAVAVL